MSENLLDIAVIGAGPHALTCVTHLLQKRKSWQRRIRVFDRSGEWLSQWRQQFAHLEIPHLRSPAVHHPDPNPFALRGFAENRAPELYPPYDLPGTSLFNQFCDRVVENWQLQRHVVKAEVIQIEPLNPGFLLTMADGNSQRAKRVVLANGGAQRFLPAWVKAIPTPYPSDRLQHSSQIDLRGLHCAGERILIIGGGLTSGHLAIGAVQRQARVTLMHRRVFYGKLFDAEPGWLGPKYLDGFQAEPCWHKRAMTVLTARDGGSLTPTVLHQLRHHRSQGDLVFQEDCQVEQVAWGEDHWQVSCSQGHQTAYDRIWVATGSQLDVMQHPLLHRIQATHPTEVVRGLPVLDRHLRWPGLELFVMGGLASLQIGPTARNLSGARMASDRIVPALVKARLPLIA